MSQNPVYVSPEKLAEMRKELDRLKTVRLREIADRIEKAKDMGDLSENADYTEAKDELAWTHARMRELDDLILRAQVIESRSTDSIAIGSKVRVEVNGKEKEFAVVGSAEADPLKGRISNESPLGLALIGKKVGEAAAVSAPSGPVIYRIKSIE
jgi:transcription elongation factor GreA